MNYCVLDFYPLDLYPLDALSTSTTPYDLPQAIVSRFLGQVVIGGPAAAFTKIYKDQGGDRARIPYLTFEIKRGSLSFYSSTSVWHDDRVTCKAWADTGDAADALLPSIRATFDQQSMVFSTGCTTAFVEANRDVGKGPGRGPNSKYIYFSSITFSARTRTGNP
jgi:hypothetical protein